jgi:hypothetical protein
MPVSKKRKKDGKQVHRSEPVQQGGEHVAHPDAKPVGPPQLRLGKPSNPFVARTAVRSAPRGR